jgi:hypothetical protein
VSEESRAAALAFARREIEPFAVTFDTIDYVEFPPVTIIEARALAGT